MNFLDSGSGWLNGMKYSADVKWTWADGSTWNWENWARGEPKMGKTCLKAVTGLWFSVDCNETVNELTCKSEAEEVSRPGVFFRHLIYF